MNGWRVGVGLVVVVGLAVAWARRWLRRGEEQVWDEYWKGV